MTRLNTKYVEFCMSQHQGMYGVPMGPVYSSEVIIQDRWDLYRFFLGTDMYYKPNLRAVLGEWRHYNPNENVHAEFLRG